MIPPVPVFPASRSRRITVLAWLAILGGGAASMISVFALLMTLTWQHNSPAGDVTGFLTVIAAPPFVFAAGIGMLRRQRWAWLGLTVLVLVFLAWTACEAMRAPREEQHVISPSGVPTTILASEPASAVPGLVAGGVLLAHTILAEGTAGLPAADSARYSAAPLCLSAAPHEPGGFTGISPVKATTRH